MKYDLNWVQHLYETDQKLKFVFFWGNQANRDGTISKACFSQWWEATFEVDGISYPSTEHWMMAEKARLFKDEAALNKILNTKSPAEAKKFGREVLNFEAETWNAEKYEIVKQGNIHKFEQDDALKNFLLNTKNRILVEASPYDTIWGIGMKVGEEGFENPFKWKGENLLGFALMEVREILLVTSK